MRRIADDPDSWGKPADLERKPITADDSKCPNCGVQWMHHMADLCPIAPQTLRKGKLFSWYLYADTQNEMPQSPEGYPET